MTAAALPEKLARFDWSLYFVTDTAQCAGAGRTVAETAAAAVRGGAGVVQVRDKDADDIAVADLTREVVAACAAAAAERAEATGEPVRDVCIVVDDRASVVASLRAEGLDVHIHVGQTDEPADALRELLGPDAIIGLSASTEAQFEIARSLRDPDGALAVDLVGIGPVWDTTTKIGAPAGLGAERASELAAAAAPLPAVAIGGIDAERAAALAGSPFAGVCAVSAICTVDDPETAAAALRAAFRGETAGE